MDIYTKAGDKGETTLYDNKRVFKDDIRVESYGTVDELIAFMGLSKNYIDDNKLYDEITMIQNKLFTVSANLATEDISMVNYHIVNEDIIELENLIDEYMNKVENIESFIVPGTNKKSSYMHVSRTVCRRAERRIVTMSRENYVDKMIIKYMNRLSDLLYAFGRYLDDDINIVQYE